MIFFFDLDGTLFNHEKTVSEKTRDALREFADAGNLIAVNTGRPAENGRTAVIRSDIPCHYIIGFNGAKIQAHPSEEEIYRTGLPIETVRGVMDIAREHGVYCQTYNDDMILTSFTGDILDYYTKRVVLPVKVTEDVFSELKAPPCKCLAIELEDHEKLDAFRRDVKKMGGEAVSCLYSSDKYLEIFPSEAGKGTAMKILCDKLGIPLSETYAAGDADNDIPMIEAAGTGVAMANASDKVKAAADIVTLDDNNNDGLVPILRKLAESPLKTLSVSYADALSVTFGDSSPRGRA